MNRGGNLLHRLRERGVLRVAASYAVIAWLLLQIADVTLEPLGLPKWVLTALIIAVAVGFPVAVGLAWFLEIGPHGIERDTAPEGAPRPSARGLRHYADFVVIGVLLVAVVVLLVRQSDLGKPKPPENPAIAVLPFENLSGDPEQEYFSDGLADELLDRLGRVPGLKVIARSSSFGFKGKDLDAKTIAERLGVTTLLEGSVRRDGQRLKLTARLVDGATGQQVWSGSFDRELIDLFAVQAELATAVVEAIVPAAKGSPAETSVAPTTDLNAYDLYLASRSQLVLRTFNSIPKSVELAEQAVRLDPDFAQGQAQLANSLAFLALMGLDRSPEEQASLRRRAEAAVHKALALDPDLSEAHGAYANLLRDTDRPGAGEQYERALELNPNNAATWHDYAVFLGNSGKRPESTRATARALELDPRQPSTWANYLSSVVEPGSEQYFSEYRRALSLVGDMPFALDRLTMPWAAVQGYPKLIMEAGIAKSRRHSDDNLPAFLNFFRAWSMIDIDRAAGYLAGRRDRAHGIDYVKVRMFLEAEALGLQGDWDALDQQFGALQARLGKDNPHVRAQMAFWLAVQGRYDEAARLTPAEPLSDESGIPPLIGGDPDWGFGLKNAAKVLTLRATDRTAEATALARERIEALQKERREYDDSCAWDGRMALASLLAVVDRRDEAVEELKSALRCGELPYGFQPQLPWFRLLDGLPAYDDLKRERERRIDRLRGELIEMERAAGLAPPPTTLQSHAGAS
jgi:TolB-like protein